MSRKQNVWENHNIVIKPFEHVTKLKYLGMIVTHKNYIHENIKAD
jgi:hypothetical protein